MQRKARRNNRVPAVEKLEEQYKPDEVAQLLGLSRSQVFNLIRLGRDTAGKAGIHPVYKLSYRVTRIPASAVNRYLEACAV